MLQQTTQVIAFTSSHTCYSCYENNNSTYCYYKNTKSTYCCYENNNSTYVAMKITKAAVLLWKQHKYLCCHENQQAPMLPWKTLLLLLKQKLVLCRQQHRKIKVLLLNNNEQIWFSLVKKQQIFRFFLCSWMTSMFSGVKT